MDFINSISKDKVKLVILLAAALLVVFNLYYYSAEDYPKTVAFLKQCQEMNIPIEDLITHTFPLDQMNEAMETNVAQKGIKIAYIAK